jgi:hypothetical protein
MPRFRKRTHSHSAKHKFPENAGPWLTRFEKIQILLSIMQGGILILTLIVAWRIGSVQNSINQQLLDMNFRLSLEVTYENDKLNIVNKGKDNVWVWGTQVRDESKTIESNGRLITPNGYYYLFTDKFRTYSEKYIGTDGEGTFPFNIFVATENGKRYTAKFLLFVKMINGTMTLNTQAIGFVESDWTK